MKPFIWGIASASYQTEDSPQDSSDPRFFEVDWDLFYKAGRIKEPRGMATYSWSEVERDIEAIKSLNVSHYRFGIEWARIEPQPGVFNDEALQAYVRLADRLIEENIVPVVCLWHFNFPSWLTDLERPDRHGWFHPEMKNYWKPYVERVLKAFGDRVTLWMPQNEPNAYAFVGYILGMFPPGQRAKFANFKKFMEAAAVYYNEAADLIHSSSPDNLVITVQNMVYWQKTVLDVTGFFWQQAMDYNFLHLDLVEQKSDIIGFNYYFKLKAFLIPGARTVDPEGMRRAIEELYQRYQKPLWITENGMQEKKDKKRPKYLRDHIAEVLKAKKDGYPVEAYFCWCLIDNFEWCMGYRERFGLFVMDPETRRLTPKHSSQVYGDLVKSERSKEKLV